MPKIQETANPTRRTRVVVIEDDPVYRQYVRQVLKKIPGVELVGESATGGEGIALCRREKPEALLLDLVLPDQQGVDVIKALRPDMPDLVIMLLTAHPRNDLPRELLRLGVQGFADKTGTAADLTKSIRNVLDGGISYISRAGLARPQNEDPLVLPGRSVSIKPDVLTKRERQIAAMVASAMSSKEVAAKLELSTRTVEKHRANIYAKLGVRDVVGLTRWCLHNGLVADVRN